MDQSIKDNFIINDRSSVFSCHRISVSVLVLTKILCDLIR